MRHTITSGLGRGYWSTSVTEQVLLCSTTLNFNNKELTFIQKYIHYIQKSKELSRTCDSIHSYKNQKNFPEHHHKGR